MTSFSAPFLVGFADYPGFYTSLKNILLKDDFQFHPETSNTIVTKVTIACRDILACYQKLPPNQRLNNPNAPYFKQAHTVFKDFAENQNKRLVLSVLEQQNTTVHSIVLLCLENQDTKRQSHLVPTTSNSFSSPESPDSISSGTLPDFPISSF